MLETANARAIQKKQSLPISGVVLKREGLFVRHYLTTPFVNAIVSDHTLSIFLSTVCEYNNYHNFFVFTRGIPSANRITINSKKKHNPINER